MSPSQEKELRAKFHEWFSQNTTHYEFEIAFWWLSKIQSLEQERTKELMELINKKRKPEWLKGETSGMAITGYQDLLKKGYNNALDDILLLITSNK